jgi:hypothetical protein
MARFDLSQYSTVAERIDLFWAKYPDGRIHTELVHFSPDQVVVKASVFTRFDDEMPTTTDYAEERPDTSPVNRVSFVENCSTSAIGRALADLGGEFTGAKRPSREEMSKVQRHEAQPVTPVPDDFIALVESATSLDELKSLWADAVAGGYSKTVQDVVTKRKGELA